jgi:autotransporter-associated beta strand protein
VNGNVAINAGGGVYNCGTLALIGSTLATSSASFGGGIYNSVSDAASLIDSTLYGNQAVVGGAVDNLGLLTAADSTLADNAATLQGGGLANSGAATFVNSIVASGAAPSGPDVSGAIKADYSLIDNTAGAALIKGSGNNVTGRAALLAPLGGYGGPTQTVPPLPGSPAIDAGNNALVPSGETTDQRGLPRIVNGKVDIGACEYQPVVIGIGPATDPSGGNTIVTITGVDLTGVTAVEFGTVPASSFTVNSSTQITAVSPAEPAGTVDVTVVAPSGVSAVSAADQLTYLTVPVVTGVSSTQAAGAYPAGTAIPIAVAFNEPVTVSGAPQLTLDDGAAANYTSGSGTSTLTFTYVVAAGQNTAHLDFASAAALALDGGSILGEAGNAAVLTLPAAGADGLAAANIVIDTRTLTVPPADWTSAGMTLMLGGDGNLHACITGTTTDAVGPCPPAGVADIQITAPGGCGCNLTIDSTAGDPVPNGSLNYGGAGGLIITGSGSVTLSGTDTYTGGTAVSAGTLIVARACALPSGTAVTVDSGGILIFGSVTAGSPVADQADNAGAVSASPRAEVASSSVLSTTDATAQPSMSTSAVSIASPAVAVAAVATRAKAGKWFGPDASAGRIAAFDTVLATTGPKRPLAGLAWAAAFQQQQGPNGPENKNKPVNLAAIDAVLAGFGQ